MTHAERIVAALNRQKVDQVPFMLNCVDEEIHKALLKRDSFDIPLVNAANVWGPVGKYGEVADMNPLYTCHPELAEMLGLDAIGIQIVPPLYVDCVMANGIMMIKDGIVEDMSDLDKIVLPDPDDDKLYRQLEEMLKRKGDFACHARIRLCCSPMLLSMGLANFAYALYEEPELVHGLLHKYADWSRRVSTNLSELDFDYFWCFDDIAYSTGLMFSADVFREFFLPEIKLAASGIKKPWVFHSDGDYSVILDDLLTSGVYGIHPLEQGSMDMAWLQENYQSKVCLCGNIDINDHLAKGTPEIVDAVVKERIETIGKSGAYIISDSNSIPAYCKPENVLAFGNAVKKYAKLINE